MIVQKSIFEQGVDRGKRIVLERLQKLVLEQELPEDQSNEFKTGFSSAILMIATVIQKMKEKNNEA